MSDGLTALASENLNPSLRSLLEDVQRGHIRVPRFQRPFIWSDFQRMELLRSIRDNMPIGSLLLWRTSRYRLDSFPKIGPHEIPEFIETAPATGWQYVLDGHQRLTTLLGLLIAPFSSTYTEEDWDIQYSLIDQDFVFRRKYDKYKDFIPLLPLWTLLDGRLVNRAMRDLRIQAILNNCSESQMDEWEDRANQLAYRFQQCRVPVVVMVSDDLELAAKTFQRINSQGTPMGEAHLVAALTWSKDFDLRDNIASMRSLLPKGWQDLDDGVYLQVCKGLLGLDVTKAAQVDFATQLFKNKNLLPRAGNAIQKVIEWLCIDIGVVREELLPYMLQVVLLSVEVDKRNSNDLTLDYEFWFWRTSWLEIFSSSTYRQVRLEQELLSNEKNLDPWIFWDEANPLPERFDFRSARVRLFALRLAANYSSVGLNGEITTGASLLEIYGREALVRLFPIPNAANSKLRLLLQGAGNRFLLDPRQDRLLRNRMEHEPYSFSSKELESLFTTREDLLSIKTLDGLAVFLENRQERIIAWDLEEWSKYRVH